MELTDTNLAQALQTCLDAIRAKTDFVAEAGIVLGTGLGGLAQEIDVVESIPYEEIPFFPPPTVLSHEGHLLLGSLGGRPVAALQGRFHRYEGYSPLEITFPIRVLHALGAQELYLSNASGGMNPSYRERDLMMLADHINMQGLSPLVGANDESLGPRFVDLLHCYDPALRKRAREIAQEEGIPLHQGIYVCVAGPNLETKAEYRMLRRMGADVVGMSTVPEVIVARHEGMRVFAASVITDMCLPDALEVAEISKILAHAGAAEPSLTALMKRLISERVPAATA